MRTYIHELTDWPKFRWSEDEVASQLIRVRHRQGRLIGRMEGLGFQLKAEAVLQTLTEEIVKSSEIEGEALDKHQVRSSIARRLGIDIELAGEICRRKQQIADFLEDFTRGRRVGVRTRRRADFLEFLVDLGGRLIRQIEIKADARRALAEFVGSHECG